MSKRPSPDAEAAVTATATASTAAGNSIAAAQPVEGTSGSAHKQQQQQQQQQQQPHFKRKRTGPGPQHTHGHAQGSGASPASVPPQTRPIGRAFAHFSAELDRHQDRRERLIKLSRDVTALSKKLIFHLHRWEHPDVQLLSPASPDAGAAAAGISVEQQALEGGRKRNAKLLADAHQKLGQIVDLLKEAARAETLGEADAARRKASADPAISSTTSAASIVPSAAAPPPPPPDSNAMDTAGEPSGAGAVAGEEKEPAAAELLRPRDSDEQAVHLAPRYDRAFGPGLEEFIEALSFLHFLEHNTIISLEDVQSHFLDHRNGGHKGEAGHDAAAEPAKRTAGSSMQHPVLLRITTERYLLGLSDLTGELMRYATNALASPAAQKANVVPRTLGILRTLADQFEPFSGLIWDFNRKQRVTLQSLRKIEQLSYSLTVRSAEFGSDPGTLAEILRRALAAGTGGGGGGGGDGDGAADDRDD